MREKSPWLPRLSDSEGPIYQRIVMAIVEDIEAGKIPKGARLPAQRDLAYSLNVGLGTVTKAYNLIGRRGIGKSEKGRAMFVTYGPSASQEIKLDANIPPNLLSHEMLGQTLIDTNQQISETEIEFLEPYQGSESSRNCIAEWMRSYCPGIKTENLIMCNGGQHSIWIALSILREKDTVVLVDELPFPGLLWITNEAKIDTVGVPMDHHGMNPEALEQMVLRLKNSKKKPVLYISPTAQNPTGVSMPNERVARIAKVCNTYDIPIIEDDVYAAFARPNHKCFYELVPQLTFYVNSLAKILSPWFRMGILVVPSTYNQTALKMISTQGSKVPPLMSQVVKHWISCGLASEIATMTHHEGMRRNKIASSVFGKREDIWIGNGFHMFLSMSLVNSKKIWSQAKARGILLTRPSKNLLGNFDNCGLRICLGGPSIIDLESALRVVAEIYEDL